MREMRQRRDAGDWHAIFCWHGCKPCLYRSQRRLAHWPRHVVLIDMRADDRPLYGTAGDRYRLVCAHITAYGNVTDRDPRQVVERWLRCVLVIRDHGTLRVVLLSRR